MITPAIREALVARRRALGLSQTQLGEAIGRSQAHMSELETGVGGASFTTLKNWADALDFDVEVRLMDRGAQ